MTDAADLLKKFEELKAAEADKPTSAQVDEYAILYNDLHKAASKEVNAYKSIMTKIKHRKTHLRMKSKIVSLAVEPGHVIVTDRRARLRSGEEKNCEWFHVDEVRGQKGYVFRGRLLSMVCDTKSKAGDDITIFLVQATSMRATEAAGWSWHSPKTISSVLGELISSGVNLKHLLDITTSLNLDEALYFAFNKEKGWAEIANQSVNMGRHWDRKTGTYTEGDVPLCELTLWDLRDKANSLLEVRWNEEGEAKAT